MFSQIVKSALTKGGARMSARGIHRVNAALNYLEVGRWMQANGFGSVKRAARREQLFDKVGEEVKHEQVLYLEFGVWKGASIRYWSQLLKNPASRLHGFDSFEGLPEDFNILMRKNDLSLEGQVPTVDDPRVGFFKGWFEETLPEYQPPKYERLVINIDCDVYSSARYVLQFLQGWIVTGTYLYFDDFSDRSHELKAFAEFLEETGMRFRVVGATRELSHVMFQRLA